MPFLDKNGLAHLWSQIIAKFNGTINKEEFDELELSLNSKIEEAKAYTDEKTADVISYTHLTGHNTSTGAHNDIRLLIQDLDNAVNKFLDVDDETVDQLSEVLTLIENNKGTLESLTTSKINVSDIVNDLTTNSNGKVLSAAQGVVIKELIDALETEISDVKRIRSYYGVCSTAAGTDAKTVTIEGFQLVEGAMVAVKFTNTNSATNPTLNVSGTGAKPIYRYGTTTAGSSSALSGWSAGAIQIFVYDGAGWIRDYWSNTTYTNASLGHGYATCTTAEATLAKTASLSSYALTTGGNVTIKFSNNVPANSTLNIASKGAKPIYYKGAAITDGVIKAGDTVTFIYSTNYHLISIDRWHEEFDAIRDEMSTAFEGKADVSHTHDEYETKEDAQVKYDELKEIKPDLAQNDELAPDYVKNRTHWCEGGSIVIFDETFTMGVGAGSNRAFDTWGTPMNLYTIPVGTACTVTFNGISYECIAEPTVYDGVVVLTNCESYDGTFTGTEFYINWTSGEDGMISCLTAYAVQTLTLKIEIGSPIEYHPLDVNYIPELITVEDIDTICGGAIQYAEDVMF